MLSRKSRDAIISRLNPLLEMTVRLGNKFMVHYGSERVEIELDTSVVGVGVSGGSGTITQITSLDTSVSITNPTGPIVDLSVAAAGKLRWKDLYSAGTDYLVNDMVYTAASGYGRVSWVCLIANGPSTSVHAPTWPEPGTVYWRALEEPGTLTSLSVVQTYGDYIQCIDSLSHTVNVAKPPLLRFSVTSRTVPQAGGTVSFSSFSTVPTTSTTDQVRIANGAGFGGSVSELIYPAYQSSDIIFAQSADHTGVFVSGVELALIDTNADGRRWVMSYGQ